MTFGSFVLPFFKHYICFLKGHSLRTNKEILSIPPPSVWLPIPPSRPLAIPEAVTSRASYLATVS